MCNGSENDRGVTFGVDDQDDYQGAAEVDEFRQESVLKRQRIDVEVGIDGKPLRKVTDVPEHLRSFFRAVFPFEYFNSMQVLRRDMLLCDAKPCHFLSSPAMSRAQSAMLDKTLSNNSIALAAPTGSGKTCIFEM